MILQSEDAPVSNISDNASNSDVSLTRCSALPVRTEPKSLEEKEMIDFLDMQNKKAVSDMMIKRNREKKLQGSFNNSTPPILSEVLTIPTSPVSLDSKNQDNNQDKLHKKKGTENIAQQKFAETDSSSNSSAIPLLELAQLFDSATDAEYYAIKANQEETLCWTNYGKEFIIQYNDIVKNKKVQGNENTTPRNFT
ncbi:2791_t:CDS:2 [Acaulospora morrowiae]|uniref:2791_t:CDS:1 n=1 Tax=Acaulospora morrowiae TaxID=94023 RepID=A0A9N8ZI71_9GLOM|nr:2791_t:CDS:2 [Acaulospora morrowiae]